MCGEGDGDRDGEKEKQVSVGLNFLRNAQPFSLLCILLSLDSVYSAAPLLSHSLRYDSSLKFEIFDWNIKYLFLRGIKGIVCAG